MSNPASEEINLLELTARLFLTLKRNLVLTIAIPLLCGIAAAFLFESRQKSAMLISTSLLTENECEYLFDELAKDPKLETLSSEEQNKVRGLDVSISSTLQSDNTTDKDPLDRPVLYLTVTADVYDPSVLASLEKAVVTWLNQTNAAQRHRAEYEKFYSSMISKIDAEIAGLDALKKQVNPQAQASYLNPSDLYSHSVELYEDRMTYEILRDDIRSVNVVKGFTTVSSTRISPWVGAMIGVIVGLVLVGVILFFKYVNEHVKKIEHA
jgi:hypothetical protein